MHAAEADFAEIAAALGVTWQAVQKRSVKESWPYREQPQRGGKKRLFPLATLPAQVREAVIKLRLDALVAGAPAPTLANLPSPVPSPAAGALPAERAERPAGFFMQRDIDLSDRQRLVRDARAGVIAAISRLQVEAACSLEAAMHTLLVNAASGRAEPGIVRALQLARDGRGRKGHGGHGDAGLPSMRTLKRWLAAHDLAPKVVQKDMRIPPWAGVFLERYQRPQKPSVEAAYREACNVWGGERPSIHQVRRFLGKLGTVTRERGRMGPRELKSLRPFVRRGFEHLEPNDIWSADGHTFDAEVQHPYHGRPFRPEIISIVDIATRKCVGWSVGLAETAVGVIDALRHASETVGLCATFYVDRGSGFANAMLKEEGIGLQGRLGFEVRHSLPYNSQARGVVERLHKTLWVDGAKLLPSYVGAAMDREARLAQFKLTRQALKKGGSLPLIPWEVFVEFCRARVAEYNARGHRSLGGVSPDLKWREFELKGWRPHTLCADDLEGLFRPRVERKLLRGEIQLFNNIYACPKLEEFHGDTVQVAYDLHKPEKVWVYSPQGKFMGEAICDGNRRHYYPVAVVQQDREKRAAARLKRVQAKAREIREELRGPAHVALPEDSVVLGTRIISTAEAVAAGRAIEARQAAVAAPTTLRRSERSIAENMAEWDAIDARMRAGEAVTEDEAFWHGSFQRHPSWKAEMKRREQEGRAEERRAAG